MASLGVVLPTLNTAIERGMEPDSNLVDAVVLEVCLLSPRRWSMDQRSVREESISNSGVPAVMRKKTDFEDDNISSKV